MNYPAGVKKFIQFFATKNDLSKEEVIETVVNDWFACVMTKMTLFGESLSKLTPFVWDKETGERFTGEWLFKILHRRHQEKLLANEANWRRRLEHVERSKASKEASNQNLRDIITELKMLTGAGFLKGQEPESEQEKFDHRKNDDGRNGITSILSVAGPRASKDPGIYANPQRILKEFYEDNATI